MGKTIERIAMGAGLGAGALIASSYLLQCSGPGIEVERQITPPEDATVVEVEPVRLDCRARTLANFANSQAKVNLKVLGVDAAADRKANVSGQVETLTCVSGNGTTIDDSDPKNVVVTVDAGSVQMWSRIVEDKTKTTFETDKLSDVADIGASFADLIGWNDLKSNYREIDSYLEQAARTSGVNHVQQKCQKVAWPLTREAVREAYTNQVEDKVSTSDEGEAEEPNIKVTFVGEPKFKKAYPMPADFKRLNGTERSFDMGEDDECKVAPGAYKGDYSYPAGENNEFQNQT